MKPVRLCFCGLCTSFTSIPIVLILLTIKTVALIYFVTVCDYNNKTKDWHRQEASNITYRIVVFIFDVCLPSQPTKMTVFNKTGQTCLHR